MTLMPKVDGEFPQESFLTCKSCLGMIEELACGVCNDKCESSLPYKEYKSDFFGHLCKVFLKTGSMERVCLSYGDFALIESREDSGKNEVV